MAHPEDPASDWSPERERGVDPEAMMKKAGAFLDKLVAGAGALDRRPPRTVRGIGAPFEPPAQITVRRILNGFVMTYFEAKPSMYVPPDVRPDIAKKIFQPHQVEAFIADPLDGSVYLKKALEAAELLAQSAKILDELQAAAVNPDEETRRLERPPQPEA